VIAFVEAPGWHDSLGEFLLRAPDLAQHIRRVTHAEMPRAIREPAAAWILASDQRPPVLPAGRVLNAEPLLRLELLQRLHVLGINTFTAHTTTSGVHLPAFVRSRYRHDGRQTPIIRTPAELARVHLQPDQMISEYCDVRSPDRLYRKYSVLRIGDAYIPRHMLVSDSWCTRTADVVSATTVAEEEAFLDAEVPAVIRRAFEVAGIEYGRIDYGLLFGVPQIWEINLNPVLVPAPGRTHRLREHLQRRSAVAIRAAFLALMDPT
jgi:hypothetical protein